MYGSDFQTVTNPPSLLKAGHAASQPEPGGLPTAKQNKLPSPHHQTAGIAGSGALGCQGSWRMGSGAEPEDHAIKPTGQCLHRSCPACQCLPRWRCRWGWSLPARRAGLSWAGRAAPTRLVGTQPTAPGQVTQAAAYVKITGRNTNATSPEHAGRLDTGLTRLQAVGGSTP